jgi:hypothetical protein
MAEAELCHCSSLRSICIPVSGREVSASALAGYGINNLAVEAGSSFFKVSGDFRADFSETRLVRYFGNNSEGTRVFRSNHLSQRAPGMSFLSTMLKLAHLRLQNLFDSPGVPVIWLLFARQISRLQIRSTVEEIRQMSTVSWCQRHGAEGGCRIEKTSAIRNWAEAMLGESQGKGDLKAEVYAPTNGSIW